MKKVIAPKPYQLETLDPREHIIIKGAKVNNLQNLSVAIARDKLVVITGVSGSGKSSLAFDTLFAEGQRMYVESLSAYARQFLGKMEKPEVEYIKGIAPAIAVEQKGNSRNPRATVGTTTEIYDYLKLLFSRIGKTYSPISGQLVQKHSVADVSDYLHSFAEGQRFVILAPLTIGEGRNLSDELKVAFQKGFSRLWQGGSLIFIEELLGLKPKDLPKLKDLYLLIDRGTVQHESEENRYRIGDSVQTAFYEGHGTCTLHLPDNDTLTHFSDRFEADGISFETPSVAFFSFNNPYGACKKCGGFGNLLDIDEDLVIPDKTLSVYEGAVAPWRTEKMEAWQKAFVRQALALDFPVHRSYEHLNKAERELLWNGNGKIEGINQFFAHVAEQAHKIQYRVLQSRYRGRVACPECRGTRLRQDAGYVKIADHSISDLVLMPVTELMAFFAQLTLPEHEQKVAQRPLIEIQNRLHYLDKVGLGYLTLNRLTSSLSGGEYQRIKLSTALGSALVGSMYVLDEPSIGLHPRDTAKLVEVLLELRDLGNTVIVVEHEEEVMRAADQIIDIGPEAGSQGGQLVLQGNIQQGAWELLAGTALHSKANGQNGAHNLQLSHTYRFLEGLDSIPLPEQRRSWKQRITLEGATENNLKNITVDFPLGVLTVVTGVSGSGKSTLITDLLYPALQKSLGQYHDTKAKYRQLSGDWKQIQFVEFVDQNPVGKSSRSNPATYTKAYDHIRQLFADQTLAKQRSYEAGHFSFNSDKGRCDACKGDGYLTIEMQFMADIRLTCESCQGKRFKREILDITYQGQTVADVLAMTIDDSLTFFQGQPKITNLLQPLATVGLGYVRLGQSTATLSGGEAQRLKLASFLDQSTADRGRTLFIFDEPTTGLHFHDIRKLLGALQALVDQGHTVIVIEHNTEVIKSADWIIDLGPDGGHQGGQLCFAGTPEDLCLLPNNHTARFLKPKID